MRILALDLGTTTGWALQDDDLRASGSWQLATPKEIREQAKADKNRCCDCRFGRLQSHVHKLAPIGVIYFEDVEFSTYTYQTQLWAGFRTVLTLMYPSFVPKLVAVPVGTLKQFATGKGNATKDMMEQALRLDSYYKSKVALTLVDDNEVDALHLLRYAIKKETYGK